jgi:hypothetical protein
VTANVAGSMSMDMGSSDCKISVRQLSDASPFLAD